MIPSQEAETYFVCATIHDCANSAQTSFDVRFQYCWRCGMVLKAPVAAAPDLSATAPVTQSTFGTSSHSSAVVSHPAGLLSCCSVAALREVCLLLQATVNPTTLALWQGAEEGHGVLHIRVVDRAREGVVRHIPYYEFSFDRTTPSASILEVVAFAPLMALLAAVPESVTWVCLCSATSCRDGGIVVIGASSSPVLLPATTALTEEPVCQM